MSATALILLILFLIGAGLAIYYAVICLQSHPKKEKVLRHPDMRPLIHTTRDQDLNGNHESAPPSIPVRSIDQPDASAPKLTEGPHASTSSKKENGLEPPLKSVTFQTTPECAAKDPKEGSVILPIDEEPSLINSSKPLLPPLQPPMKAPRAPNQNYQDGPSATPLVAPPMQHQQHPQHPQHPQRPQHQQHPQHQRPQHQHSQHPQQQQPQPILAKNPHHIVAMPLLASDVPLKAMSVSYEEDGLLVPRSPSQHLPPEELQKHNDPATTTMAPIPPQTRPKSNAPKHVQFITPFINPSFIVESSNPQEDESEPIESKLKEPVSNPPSSVPETIKEENPVFVFGTKHKSDENSDKPSKKAKMSPSEDFKTEDIVPSETKIPVFLPKDEPNVTEDSKEEAPKAVATPTKNDSDSRPTEEVPEDEDYCETEPLPGMPAPLVGWCVTPISEESFDPKNESVHSSRDEVTERSPHLELIREVDERELEGGYSPQPPSETSELSTETSEPTSETLQPSTETLPPTSETPKPTSETRPKSETPQPSTETFQSSIETSQPSTETPQPASEPLQPKSEPLPTSDPLPTSETPQPSAETPHPPTKTSAPITELPPSAEPEEKDDPSPVTVRVTFPSEDEDDADDDDEDDAEGRPDISSPESCCDQTSDSDEDESSEPDVTEYSFEVGPHSASTATVLENEVSCYSDTSKVGLTHYVPLPESSPPAPHPPTKRTANPTGHPPTPTSDTTKSPSPLSSNDTSLEDINPNILSTPPTTPPEGKTSPSSFILREDPSTEEPRGEKEVPSFIVIEPHEGRARSSSSSSSGSSASSTDGSYKIEAAGKDESKERVAGSGANNSTKLSQ